MVLIKKDNPIDLYYDSKDDIFYFCSEREIMQEALNIDKVTVRGFNLGEKDFHVNRCITTMLYLLTMKELNHIRNTILIKADGMTEAFITDLLKKK